MTDYTLIRSSRRTLGLEITADLRVVVRVPRRCAQREIDRFVAAHEVWIEKHMAMQRARQAAAQARQASPEEEGRFRVLAATILPQKVAYYSRIMGVTPTGVKITSAKKRFGSCSGQNSLCFSWRLMQYPPEAVDYVVVHELAHIRHHNHSAAFYALVEKYMPDYREREKLLRQ